METSDVLKAGHGRVASLHLHPCEPGAPLEAVSEIRVVEGKGVEGEPRYFGRQSSGGRPSRRQVTLIGREQVASHAEALGLGGLEPGIVRSNIETEGIDLAACVGREVQVGEARLFCYEARKPCAKMDAIARGLRGLMEGGRQGVMAEVVRSGRIAVGDAVRVC